MVRGFSGPPTSPPAESRFARHEHEWMPEEDSPYIEDGAAIFIENCCYEETKSVDMGHRGIEYIPVGPQCDESRSYGFGLAYLTQIKEGEPNITYLASEFDRFSHLPLENIIVSMEREGEITDIDPDEEYGSVTVKNGNWVAVYRANHNPQSDPIPNP